MCVPAVDPDGRRGVGRTNDSGTTVFAALAAAGVKMGDTCHDALMFVRPPRCTCSELFGEEGLDDAAVCNRSCYSVREENEWRQQ